MDFNGIRVFVARGELYTLFPYAASLKRFLIAVSSRRKINLSISVESSFPQRRSEHIVTASVLLSLRSYVVRYFAFVD